MQNKELKLDCELLIRKRSNYLTFSFLLFILIMIAINLSLPNEGNYSGFLLDYGWQQYIPDISFLYIALLLLAGKITYLIIISSLKIKGSVIITPEFIKIIRWHKFNYTFNVHSISNLIIRFNYFKKNDTEPRNLVDGNNNILRFTKMKIPFKYEFLLETKEEDEIFREIINQWENNNIPFKYYTTLADL
jgi:hypothetical protein